MTSNCKQCCWTTGYLASAKHMLFSRVLSGGYYSRRDSWPAVLEWPNDRMTEGYSRVEQRRHPSWCCTRSSTSAWSSPFYPRGAGRGCLQILYSLMYVVVYMSMSLSLSIHIYIYIYIHITIHIYIYIYIHTHVYAYTHIAIRVLCWGNSVWGRKGVSADVGCDQACDAHRIERLRCTGCSKQRIARTFELS